MNWTNGIPICNDQSTCRLGLTVIPDPTLLAAGTKKIADLSAKARLPAIYGTCGRCGDRRSYDFMCLSLFPICGATRRHLCRQDPQRRQAGGSARGAADEVRAGDQSQKQQSRLVLTIPPNMLARADRVIKSGNRREAARQTVKEYFCDLTENVGVNRKLLGHFMVFCSDNRKSKIQNRKWAGIFAIVATFVFGKVEAQAQQPKKVPRIGYLSSFDPANDSTGTEAILLALRELGYVEGQNLSIEYRYAEGKLDRLPELAAELVRLKVDIIVVSGGGRPVREAKNATKTIPIVMAGFVADPVELGLVKSLARPGGNVTGFSSLSRELAGKRLELLKEAVPKITRVAVLYDPAIGGSVREVKEDLPVAARALRLTLQPWEIRAADDFEKVFAALSRQRPDGLYVSGGPLINNNQKRIAGFALKSRLPSMKSNKDFVVAGGLMYYAADLADSYRRVATYVDKILKGAKPGDLPVEQPTKFELVINLKTAKQIGVTIPQAVLARADRVIR